MCGGDREMEMFWDFSFFFLLFFSFRFWSKNMVCGSTVEDGYVMEENRCPTCVDASTFCRHCAVLGGTVATTSGEQHRLAKTSKASKTSTASKQARQGKQKQGKARRATRREREREREEGRREGGRRWRRWR